jgi:hypothetical protein
MMGLCLLLLVITSALANLKSRQNDVLAIMRELIGAVEMVTSSMKNWNDDTSSNAQLLGTWQSSLSQLTPLLSEAKSTISQLGGLNAEDLQDAGQCHKDSRSRWGVVKPQAHSGRSEDLLAATATIRAKGAE